MAVSGRTCAIISSQAASPYGLAAHGVGWLSSARDSGIGISAALKTRGKETAPLATNCAAECHSESRERHPAVCGREAVDPGLGAQAGLTEAPQRLRSRR